MKKLTLLFSFCIFLLTMITACGGGGGGTTSGMTSTTQQTPPVVQPTPVTPPVVQPTPVTPPAVQPTPVTPSNVIIRASNRTPPPSDIDKSMTAFFNTVQVVINNPTDANQKNVISSVTVEGDLASSISNVRIVDDTNNILGTSTISGGKVYFQNITIDTPAKTSKTLWIQAKLDPNAQPLSDTEWFRKVRFGITSDDITPSQAPISGLPVWSNYAYLEKGSMLYPCPNAICPSDMESGKHIVLWGRLNTYPTKIIPTRDGKNIAFTGGNYNGLQLLSLSTLSEGTITDGSWDTCSTGPGFNDVSEDGVIVAVSSGCSTLGSFGEVDVGLIKTGSNGGWLRVTNDYASEFSVTFGSAVTANSKTITVLYAKNLTGQKTSIWKTVVDTNTNEIISNKMITSEVSGFSSYTNRSNQILSEDRVLSVNKDYTRLVFVKKVGNEPHLFTTSINGGTETDIGEGQKPFWSTDGSDRILFMSNKTGMTIVNPDGTNRRKIRIPSNLATGLASDVRNGIVLSSKFPMLP